MFKGYVGIKHGRLIKHDVLPPLKMEKDESVASNVTLAGKEESVKEFVKWNSRNSKGPDIQDGQSNTTLAQDNKISKKNQTILERYELIEDKILNELENVLSCMDNYLAIQAIFPSFEKSMKKFKFFKPFNFLIKQIAKIYMFMLIIYLKKFILKLIKINKLIKLVKIEYEIIGKNYLLRNVKSSKFYENSLKLLYTEKLRTVIEIIGYLNDMILNFSVINRKFKLTGITGKFIGFISWLMNVYRLCRDEKEELKVNKEINAIELRFKR